MSDISIGRNTPCNCGSGKRYKECCGRLAANAISESASVEAGVAHMNAGNLIDAVQCFRTALVINPRSLRALENLAAALLASRQIPEALNCYRRLVEVAPQSANAFSTLGSVLYDLGLLDESIQCHRRALELAPDHFDSQMMIGNAFRAKGNAEEALASFRRALQSRPNSPEVLVNIATTLRLKGQTSVAEAECRKAIASEPQFAAMWTVLGEVLADEGRFEEAEECFNTALSINPALHDAWYGMAYVRKQSTADQSLWIKAEELADNEPLAAREVPLRYAIAKYHDDTQNYAKAFENYRRANELCKLFRPPHDRLALSRSTEDIIRTYSQEWLAKFCNLDNRDAKPVFVVGMMRSGTSLVEQMLASHPRIFGAGELGFWSSEFFRFDALSNDVMARAGIESIGARHAAMTNAMSTNAVRIVDKTPINFLFLGLIHAVLPHARIIHMQRNPVDTCLSIYFQNFERTITYANDLEDIAHTYREYQRIMKHWHEVLPGEVLLDVPYEALVDDPEKWGRKVLEFIDMPWDEGLLNFHNVNRTVLTASKWQVRQRINKNAIERWRNYESFIDPLLPLVE